MKRKLIPLSLSCMLSVLCLQASGAEEPAAAQQRDCSKIGDYKKRARCEEVNRALIACSGRQGEALNACMREQYRSKN